jgi:hypothetical protein
MRAVFGHWATTMRPVPRSRSAQSMTPTTPVWRTATPRPRGRRAQPERRCGVAFWRYRLPSRPDPKRRFRAPSGRPRGVVLAGCARLDAVREMVTMGAVSLEGGPMSGRRPSDASVADGRGAHLADL